MKSIVSLWQAKPFAILISRKSVCRLEEPAQTFPWDGTTSTSLQDAISLFLGKAQSSVVVLLSPDLTYDLALPALGHWLHNKDLDALTTRRISDFYGLDIAVSAVGRNAQDKPTLASGITPKTRTTIIDTFKALALRVSGIYALSQVCAATFTHACLSEAPSALWLESPDTVWLGLYCENKWLSARCIPAKLLSASKRPDILRRECMSSGHPAPHSVTILSLDEVIPDPWGIPTQAIDVARLPSAIASTPSFIPTPVGPMSKLSLVAAFIATLYCGHIWHVQNQETIEEEARLVSVETARKALAAAHQAEERELRAKAQVVLSAYERQLTAWDGLVSALNESAKDVALLSLKADADEGAVALEGDTAKFEDVQSFMDRLRQHSNLQDLKLVSMSPIDEMGTQRVRFILTLRWLARSLRPAKEAL